MPRATLILHQPEHRRRSLALQADQALAALAYDRNVAAYFEFLRSAAREADFELRTEPAEGATLLRLEGGHEDKLAAHRWLTEQPDLWNWLPALDESNRPAASR